MRQAGQSKTNTIVDKYDSKEFAGYYATPPPRPCHFHPNSIKDMQIASICHPRDDATGSSCESPHLTTNAYNPFCAFSMHMPIARFPGAPAMSEVRRCTSCPLSHCGQPGNQHTQHSPHNIPWSPLVCWPPLTARSIIRASSLPPRSLPAHAFFLGWFSRLLNAPQWLAAALAA